MDPVTRAQMANLIQLEKKTEKELEELREELATWRSRVDLALEKGMDELAAQAGQRVEELRTKGRALRTELDVIEMDKSMILKQAARTRGPTGQEVRRAEALLDSFRESGLVDPEEATLNRELRELQSQMDVERLKDDDK